MNNIPEEVQLALAKDILYADIIDIDCRNLLKTLFSSNPLVQSVAPSYLNNSRAEECLNTITRIAVKYNSKAKEQ